MLRKRIPSRPTPQPQAEKPLPPRPHAALIPLGAMAAGFGLACSSAFAQTTAPAAPAGAASAPSAAAGAATEAALPQIKVRAAAEVTSKDSVRATTTRIGKSQQELRDVPQSITVITERLIDDRNLDTLKDSLRSTAGISFQAAEGAEEDIRLRGFALQSTGDIFLDGMRDPGFYERDSFNWDRLEVLRGSASMLFGRGSTGGAVNQVNKQPMLLNQNEIALTVGSGDYWRWVSDFNLKTGDDAALRINALLNLADNDGNKIDKQGIAPTFRWGIGTKNEFSAGLYHLQYRNGIDYGYPWLQSAISEAFQPGNYYGARSDYMAGGTTYGTFSHMHRFNTTDELRTVLRTGTYVRDQRASAIRFCQPNATTGVPNARCPASPLVTPENIGPTTALTRGSQNKIQDMDGTYLQSDYSARFGAFGLKHDVLAGADMALEDFNRFAAVLPPGVTVLKPITTIGTPNDGGEVNENQRLVRQSQQFDARAVGVYAQDLVEVAPKWKLLAGLRWDQFKGQYRTYATAANATTGVAVGDQTADRGRTDSVWSRRFGVLYQPTDRMSYHLSYGTSFNTSGDTYAFDPRGSNTPPEKSRNVELGGSMDWAGGNFTTRFAIFHTTKYNERNDDVDTVDETNYVLSGQRHAAGIDLDFSGRLTKAWEVFAAYSYIPDAKVDKGASNGTTLIQGEVVGQRPAMTPQHSGTFWTTYRVTPKWRIGGGLNAKGGVKPLLANFHTERYITGDLMAEYSTGPFDLKLNVSNVTDKLYADQLYRGHYVAGKPRTVQLTASTKF